LGEPSIDPNRFWRRWEQTEEQSWCAFSPTLLLRIGFKVGVGVDGSPVVRLAVGVKVGIEARNTVELAVGVEVGNEKLLSPTLVAPNPSRLRVNFSDSDTTERKTNTAAETIVVSTKTCSLFRGCD